MTILYLYLAFSYGFMLNIVINEGSKHWFDMAIWLLSPLSIFVLIYTIIKEKTL